MSEKQSGDSAALRLAQLRRKALELPVRPGVYLMKDAGGRILYVGKSKALKHRVSQYFDAAADHNLKTRKMVSQVRSFETVLCDTEIEALALENKLIKLHRPKYNIRLKDDKSYPYIRLSKGNESEWPTLTVTRTRKNDRARYFGPYSGVSYAYHIVETVRRVLGLPSCKYRFPDSIGKIRPCLYAQIGQCAAPCTGTLSYEDYDCLLDEAVLLLRGSVQKVEASLREQMNEAAKQLRFESAAHYRDRIAALQKLWDKQKVVGAPDADYDAAALFQGETCSCLAVGFVREGVLADTDYLFFHADQIVDEEAILSALYDLYSRRESLPKELLLDFPLENLSDLSESLSALSERGRLTVRTAERGDKKATCRLLWENAALRTKEHETTLLRDQKSLLRLAELLQLETLPETIESVDISNLGSEHITAGLVLFRGGKSDKRGYRTYKIRSVTGKADDYAAMREAVERRLEHAQTQPLPDLLLLDGGKGHVNTVRALLAEKGVAIPTFGMVKDEYHKTRTLTDGIGEISIAGEPGVFTLVYRIQEEVHRFTVGRMMQAKRKTLKSTRLTEIPGIGEKKAALLRRQFGTIAAIAKASEEELACVPGISAANAAAVYRYFQGEPLSKREEIEEITGEENV